MVIQPGFKGYVLAADGEPLNQEDPGVMPEYRVPFQKNQEAYKVDVGEEVTDPEEPPEDPQPNPEKPDQGLSVTNDNQKGAEAAPAQQNLGASPGRKITLSNGVILTEQDDGTFKDNDGNKWVTKDGSYQQIDFDKGDVITLNSGAKLTAQSDYSLDKDFNLPDGVQFKDEKGNRWIIKGSSFLQIDFDAGQVITLNNGTKLTAKTDFSLDKDFKVPDNLEFTDQDGNKWVTKDGSYQQIGVNSAIVITLNNGVRLTSATPFTSNADGSLPAGVLFTDKNGNIWVTTADNRFTWFDPKKTPVSSLQIVATLKGMNSADAAALLAKCDPTIAGMILMGTTKDLQKNTTPLFSDQQITDILKAMGTDSAAALLNSLSSIEPRIPRISTILGIMDPAEVGKIFSSDKISADKVAFLLGPVRENKKIGKHNSADSNKAGLSGQQIGAILSAMDTDRAAEVLTMTFLIRGTVLIHKESGGPLPGTQQDVRYSLTRNQLERMKALQSGLANMDPTKAAAILADPNLSLTTAAKALFGVPKSKSISVSEDEVSTTPLRGAILAALATLDPDRARNINEVLANFGKDFGAVMQSMYRHLTADEKTYYTMLLGFTPESVKETYLGGRIRREFTKRQSGWITAHRAIISQKIDSQGIGPERVVVKGLFKWNTMDLARKINTLSTDDAAKLLEFLSPTTAVSILASDKMAVDKSKEILGKMDKAQAETILAALDKTNALKSDVLEVKLGIEPDISKMTADEAAEYLAGLDPKKAAIKLTMLTNEAKIKEFFNNNLGRDPSTIELEHWLNEFVNNTSIDLEKQMLKSICKTDEFKAFASEKIKEFYKIILGRDPSAKEMSSWSFTSLYRGKTLTDIKNELLSSSEFKAKTDKKSVEEYNVLLGMTSNAEVRAAEILTSDNFTSEQAADILSAMIDVATKVTTVPGDEMAGPNTVTTINSSVAAGILSSMDANKAGDILGKLSTEKASVIISSDKMSVENAAAILAKAPAQQVTNILTLLDKTKKTKADQIRAKITAIDTSWLQDLSKLTPEDAAKKIQAYVKDNATAKEVAAALAKLTPVQAAGIIASANMSVENGAKILAAMDATKAAAILNAGDPNVVDKGVIPADKAAAFLEKMDIDKAAAIFAKSESPFIIDAMDKQKAADILSRLDPGRAAFVLTANPAPSGNPITAQEAAKILSLMDETKSAAILAQIDIIDDVKADQIRQEMSKTQTRWSYVIDQDGTLFWGDSSRGMPEPGKMYLQVLTPLTAEETEQYFAYLKGLDNTKIIDLIKSDKISVKTATTLITQLDPTKAAGILTAMIGTADVALRGIMAGIDADVAATIVSKMDPATVKVLFRQIRSETDLPPGMTIPPQLPPFVTKEKAAAILASKNMSVDTAVKILKDFTFKDVILAELDKINKPKADQIRTAMQQPTIPVRPPDTETDSKVWQKYYADYVKYINSIPVTDVDARKIAWDTISADILEMSKNHPELITAAAINGLMAALTQELKTKYRDPNYKLDVLSAQANLMDAALNMIKNKSLDDASKISISANFTNLAIESSWRSAFNGTNQALYGKISAFYKELLTNGSTEVKARSFANLMHLWRIDVWNSKEGNKIVANDILKNALPAGGINELVDVLMGELANSGSTLTAEEKGWIASALAEAIWQHEALNTASGENKITDARLTDITQRITAFLNSVNDKSKTISDGLKSHLVNTVGAAVCILLAEGKYSSAESKAMGASFITLAKNLLLDANSKGTISYQTSVINVLVNVMNHAKNAKKDLAVEQAIIESIEDVFLDEKFDANAFIDKARNEMRTTPNADYGAWVGTAVAKIEKFNLEHKDEIDASKQITTDKIELTVDMIKEWLLDPKKDNLKNMREMAWQAGLYKALADLMGALANDKELGGILKEGDSSLADDLVAIFETVSGLKDSLVKDIANESKAALIATLKANGFTDLAARLEAIK
jgi:flagellar motility protein MotE (MotC chaperone)